MPGSSQLHEILQARGIDTLIITGTATNVCCKSTARDAMQMNYKVIFVADGNAALTDAEHNATLDNMVVRFADVMTTAELVGDSSTRQPPCARRRNNAEPQQKPPVRNAPVSPSFVSRKGTRVSSKPKVKIAHLAGPTATIQNSPPLVTSNKARKKYGLPPRPNPDGSDQRFDTLRAQRLAAPATVYVERFSAHPLEADAAELYGPPDGYLDTKGVFHKERSSPQDKAVFEIEIRPEDGVYPLPYMARQANGQAWEEECVMPGRRPSRPAKAFILMDRGASKRSTACRSARRASAI